VKGVVSKVFLTTPSPPRRGHPSFKKEGKVLIHNIITFSSSSEEEYPDRSVRGRW